MFTYQQNKSTECFPCVAQTFKALTQDPETAKKIDEVRRLNACGQIAKASKELEMTGQYRYVVCNDDIQLAADIIRVIIRHHMERDF